MATGPARRKNEPATTVIGTTLEVRNGSSKRVAAREGPKGAPTMAYVLVEHRIGKWSEFEGIFKADSARRKALGSLGGTLYRNADDPANLFAVFQWKDAEGARKFVHSLETHEAMEWATSGISSQVHLIEEALEVEA
jgi:hypothetical protein